MKKLKAHSLFLVLIIAIVIGLLSAGLILHSYYYRTQQLYSYSKISAMNDVSSGLALLQGDENIVYDEAQELNLFDDVNTVIIIKKHWGLFDLLISKSKWKKTKFSKIALSGNYPDAETALYLQDQNRPLSLAGKTKIVGRVYIPKAGVKRAYIESKNYHGSQLIYGTTLNSSTTFPTIDEEVISSAEYYFNKKHLNSTDYLTDLDDKYDISFDTNTLYIHSSGVINLSNKELKGNIVITSTQGVIINRTTKLEDVLIYAPYIECQSHFNGNAQFFATDSIIIDEHCHFNYPSVISLIRGGKQMNQRIEIGSNTEVKGIITVIQKAPDRNLPLLRIHRDSKVIGQVYVDGLFDLQGVVNGTVRCRKFVLKTRSSVYENHLLDAVIDETELPDYFIGSALVFSKRKRGVVKWLK